MSANGNGHGAEAHIEAPVRPRLTTLLVPISHSEVTMLQIVATLLEALEPFTKTIGVTDLGEYRETVAAIVARWRAELDRPTRESEATI